ncbi:hypothetical protein [Nonlabens xiamenensis]|uniref:hypothetical protein n=1 Tax=Nonlabens xiamenensis TaxID=2341043 RepID=UPI000F61485B|nr:hypothetical protein [Nonlabens xiamenensis]
MTNSLFAAVILVAMVLSTAMEQYFAYAAAENDAVEWVNLLDGEEQEVDDQYEEQQILVVNDLHREHSYFSTQLFQPFKHYLDSSSLLLSKRDTPPPRYGI